MGKKRGGKSSKSKASKQRDEEEATITTIEEKKTPRIIDGDKINESDDEEIDEDEAFNSEDERLFGHFFTDGQKPEGGGGGDSDSESVSSNSSGDSSDDGDNQRSSDEDEDDGGQHMLDLLNNLDNPPTNTNDHSNNMAGIPESEYASNKNITLENLMEGIEDTQDFKHLQKSFKKEYTATTTPLEKVKADRTGRIVAYQEQAKNISGWTKAVQQNRKAETLDFKPKQRLELTRDTLIDKFEASTDFEIELEQALEEAGQKDEEAVLKAEEQALQDDLGANRLTLEEYKKRRGQLAQVRALMFSYEQKRHHMKKIKSKKYRRIRKKQRERVKEAAVEAAMEADEDFATEFKEKEEVARIQERMTLAHKNTSKWARRVLKRGKNVDLETRRALSAQLKRGDDLRQKMMGDGDGDSDDDEEEDLVESAREVLADVEEGSQDPTSGKTGLFKLSFMQKGIQKQRELAKQEARKLLSELESNERDDFNDMIEHDENDEDLYEEKKRKTAVVANAKEMKNVLQDGKLVATSLEFGKSNKIATSGGIDIDVDISSKEDQHSRAIEEEKEAPVMTSNGTSEYSSTMVVKSAIRKDTPGPTEKIQDSSSKESRLLPKVASTVSTADDEANPWLQKPNEVRPVSEATLKANKKKRKMVDIESAVDILESAKKTKQADADVVGGKEEESGSTHESSGVKKLSSMTQEELVRKAFATPSDEVVDDEFQKEKEEIAAEDDPTRKVEKEGPKEVAGWGSWTGKGSLPPPRRRKAKLPKKLRAPVKRNEQSKIRIDDSKPNVIVNQKRLKKTANSFMLGDVPHPYSSRAEYEQAMLGGVGKEWNVTQSYKSSTRPEILTRAGQIILPMSKKAKQRAPAKF